MYLASRYDLDQWWLVITARRFAFLTDSAGMDDLSRQRDGGCPPGVPPLETAPLRQPFDLLVALFLPDHHQRCFDIFQ